MSDLRGDPGVPAVPGPTPPSSGLLRVALGRIERGGERAFVDHLRESATPLVTGQPALRGFSAGYLRDQGTDRFIVVSHWDPSAVAAGLDVLGPAQPRAGDRLAGVATVEAVDEYESLPPADGGIVDFPGGVIRHSRATIRPERLEAGYERLKRSAETLHHARLLVSQYVGRAFDTAGGRIMTASVWPSLAALESFVGPRPSGGLLFPEMQGFFSEVAIEHFTTFEIGFSTVPVAPPRRAVAIRFRDRATADAAVAGLRAALDLGSRDLVVAPLGHLEGGEPSVEVVIVLRVLPEQRFEAERLVLDLAGELLAPVP